MLKAAEAELPEEVVAVSSKKMGLQQYEMNDLGFFKALKILDLSDNCL